MAKKRTLLAKREAEAPPLEASPLRGELVVLANLNRGEKFLFEGTPHYVVGPVEDKLLAMSLILVGKSWSGKEYREFSPDIMVERISL